MSLLDALGQITPISSNVTPILPHIQKASIGASALDWFNQASGMLGSQNQQGSNQAGGVNQSGAVNTSKFDASGWTVATGGSDASGGLSKFSLLMIGGILAYFLRRK